MSNIEDMDCAKENLDRLHARIDAILTLCEGYFLSVSSNSPDSKRSIRHSEDVLSRILSIAAGERRMRNCMRRRVSVKMVCAFPYKRLYV